MEKSNVMRVVEEKINNMEEFSGVIKVKKGEKVIFEKVCGLADISNDRKNNMNTKFGIASGAKLFTSIAICKLVEERKLSFDTLLKEYLDEDNFDDRITIKHLLTHTSGLPDYFDEEVMDDFSELWRDNPMYMMIEPKDFIPLMKNQKMMFKPGEKFHYNNGAFVILAFVVEKVTKMKFVDYVREKIFDFLEMHSSGYFRMDMLPNNCAYGYEETSDGILKSNIYSIPVIGGGDGGVFVTAHDLSKLWYELLNYNLLNKEITDELLAPQVNVEGDVYYGLGIWIVKREGEIYKYFITGSDPGVSFESAVYPSEELEVTILGNREFSTYEIIKEIEEVC